MSVRCELSDLPVDQCACRIHVPTPASDSQHVIVARFTARFDDSHCADCGRFIDKGDQMARTSDGDYICEECS